MPIYNEAPARVFAAVQAICEDVRATGLGDNFDYFFLSDTTNPDVWIAEERALLAMRERLPDERVYYRRRRKNVSRKAGNIADFVMRWGAAYPQMLVLDADSLMSGATIVRLAAAMEADPDAGIVQSLPLIVNRNTFFARLQQFAARIAGPVIAAGLAAWMGRDGNYWGHNAIIRTRAFADHCGMPDLPGKPPFGGHILSHDFVEAALIRRAGWAVYMLPTLGGSYEESPPSLIDLAARDRRWCQGNLQHARVLPASGLAFTSRLHLINGIMGYLASPLWMAQLLIGIVLVLQSRFIRPEYFTAEFSLFPTWPRFDYERALQLFELTIAVLLAPKVFGMIAAGVDPETRRGCGGAILLFLSTLIEILVSAALASIMMVIQSGAVLQILSGRDTGWNPQRRDDGSIPIAVDRAPPPLAHGARRRHSAGGGRAVAFAGGVDVADDRRPHPVDPAVVGERPDVDRRRPAPPRPADDPRGERTSRRSSPAPTRCRPSSPSPAPTTKTRSRRSSPIRPCAGRTNRSCPRRAAAAAAKSTSTRRSRPPSSTTPSRSKTPASG